MTGAADCVERMIQFRQRCPGAEFDLKPNLFTARVPGRDEPFVSMSLCKLMDAVERWAAEEFMAGLLSGAGPAERQEPGPPRRNPRPGTPQQSAESGQSQEGPAR